MPLKMPTKNQYEDVKKRNPDLSLALDSVAGTWYLYNGDRMEIE
jgi:hypothetical protein